MQPSKQRLSDEQLREFLHTMPEWAHEERKLVRFWTFHTFRDAIQFVNRVAELAEEANHHPDIDIRYNRVKLALASHDCGGITERDINLARRISEHSRQTASAAA